MKLVRVVVGVLLLVLALPVLLGGGGLWALMQHRGADGSFTARIEPISTDGYAVVVPDLDAQMRRQVTLAKGDTTLRLTARTPKGPAFVGLAPSANVARYLTGVAYTQVDEVRPARGPLPLRTSTIGGTAKPASAPATQDFWRHTSDTATGTLVLPISDLRGQRLALVVMTEDATPALSLDMTAALNPRWLSFSTWGLLTLGTVLLLVGIAVLTWPVRPREIVYVVDPSQMPDIAARLGAPAPALTSPAVASPREGSSPGAPSPEEQLSWEVSLNPDVRAPTLAWPVSSPPPVTPILDWPPLQSSPRSRS